jgi:hypothetical protein
LKTKLKVMVEYQIDIPTNFSAADKQTFLKLLIEQKKVVNPSITKIENCKLLCTCRADNMIVAIGAIKPKTAADFGKLKANLIHVKDEFEFELGYCYTKPKHTRKGYSSRIVQKLLESNGRSNLMASTELTLENSMKRILERNGFKHFGSTWKSVIHGGSLGLFLRYET